MNALRTFLLWSFLMAAGITQTGVGASILLEDQAHADASLDGIAGSYSFNDIGLKALPSGDYVDNATSRKSYRSKVSIVNGDGFGTTTTTTLKDSNFSLFFDSGKGLTISNVGRANRHIEFGAKISGTKDSGGDLWKLVAGAAMGLQGNQKLYGGTIENLSGNILLTPTADATTGELINCIIQPAASLNVGVTSPFQKIYNLDIVIAAGLNNAVGSLAGDSCERITIALKGSGTNTRFILTSGSLKVRDLVLIGTPITDCIRYNGATEAFLVEPTWAQAVAAITQNVVGLFGEWWRFEPIVQDSVTAIPLSGAQIQVYGQQSGLMLTAVTDAEGRIDYNLPGLDITANCLRPRYIASGTSTWIEEWPISIVVNGDGALSTYDPATFLVTWPYRTYLSGAQKQLEPLQESLGLQLSGTQPGGPRILVNDVPVEADDVDRIITDLSGRS